MRKFAEFTFKDLTDIFVGVHLALTSLFWRQLNRLFPVVAWYHIIDLPEVLRMLVDFGEIIEDHTVFNDLFSILFASKFESQPLSERRIKTDLLFLIAASLLLKIFVKNLVLKLFFQSVIILQLLIKSLLISRGKSLIRRISLWHHGVHSGPFHVLDSVSAQVCDLYSIVILFQSFFLSIFGSYRVFPWTDYYGVLLGGNLNCLSPWRQWHWVLFLGVVERPHRVVVKGDLVGCRKGLVPKRLQLLPWSPHDLFKSLRLFPWSYLEFRSLDFFDFLRECYWCGLCAKGLSAKIVWNLLVLVFWGLNVDLKTLISLSNSAISLLELLDSFNVIHSILHLLQIFNQVFLLLVRPFYDIGILVR